MARLDSLKSRYAATWLDVRKHKFAAASFGLLAFLLVLVPLIFHDYGISGRVYLPALVLRVDGQQAGANTIGVEQGVHFDIDGDGFIEKIGWLGPGDFFLVRDLNSNGIIDGVQEMFGGEGGTSPFDKLAALDDPRNGGNGDGLVSNADEGWTRLWLWQDPNRNTKIDHGELVQLQSTKVSGLDPRRRAYVKSGVNKVDGKGRMLGSDGNSIGEYSAVHFLTHQVDSWYVGSDLTRSPGIDDESAALPRSRGFGNMPDLGYAMTSNTKLKAMVRNFVDLDLNTEMDQVNTLAHQIIMEWSGASKVSHTGLSMDNKIDSQIVAAYGIWADQDPKTINLSDWKASGSYPRWQPLFGSLKTVLLVQGPLQPVFRGSYYDMRMDDIVFEDSVEEILSRASNLAPTDKHQRVFYWSEIGRILLENSSFLGVSALQLKKFTDAAAGKPVVVYKEFYWSHTAGTNYGGTVHPSSIVLGSRFAEKLNGGKEEDIIRAGAGDDTIGGNRGDDVILGEGGGDKISGGPGADTIVYRSLKDSTASDQDVIYDFVRTQRDKIHLDGLGFTGIKFGSGSGSMLGYTHSGSDTVIDDTHSNFSILIKGRVDLVRSDFIFD